MRSRMRGAGRVGLIAGLAIVAVIGATIAAQQPPARGRGPTPVTQNFTGGVSSLDASDVRSVRFQYEPGARSYWHVHDGLQVLLIEKGRGRMQLQGQPIKEMVPGQPVFLPAGVPHWHGAAPNEGLTWISTSIGSVKWMNAVTDQEYLGK